ncbi:sensor histidine kinase [Parafrankia elaeagni]|uniref:sensor histidine kinase n=1 Tax=Parafrankia elaeagni TaxID=222534 RepID=UPI000360F265|nr:histidine kinase [Parafrankia elaeagni]
MRAVQAARRARAADVALMLCAAGFAVFVADSVPVLEERGSLWRAVDAVAAVVGCVALLGRRRWPVPLAVVLLVADTQTPLLAGPVVVAVFTVAARCPRRVTAWVAALAFAPLPLFLWRVDSLEEDRVGRALTYFTLVAGAVGWGLFRQSRGQLIASLRERAELAEADAALRGDQARAQVREEIAREMHDVLGHRLSLLAVHAGALEFNTGASREQVVVAAGVIRENAHLALRDLREVIGVLRGGESLASGAPQPELADLGRLVAEARVAGGRVGLRMPLAGAVPPATVGRAAFRIVQEALTNARLHAAGAAVDVRVAGAPGQGLTVIVTTTTTAPAVVSRPGAGVVLPGGGRGLAGLAERARLVGGVCEAGPTGTGFVVRAWLPWPAEDGADGAADGADDTVCAGPETVPGRDGMGVAGD